MSYTHVLNRGARGVRSPLDRLDGPFDASGSRPLAHYPRILLGTMRSMRGLSRYTAGRACAPREDYRVILQDARVLHARIIALYCRTRVCSTRALSRYTAEHSLPCSR
jgi:hypothetical protein